MLKEVFDPKGVKQRSIFLCDLCGKQRDEFKWIVRGDKVLDICAMCIITQAVKESIDVQRVGKIKSRSKFDSAIIMSTLLAIKRGESRKDICKRLGVTNTCLWYWNKRYGSQVKA